MMQFLKRKPFIFIPLLICLIIGLRNIPYNQIFQYLGFPEESFPDLIFFSKYGLLILLSALLLWKLKIPHAFFKKAPVSNYFYLLATFIPAALFSGGFMDFRQFDFGLVEWTDLTLYTAKTFTSAFFEELFFRGVIMGLFLFMYGNSQKGLLKSVLLSSLVFGLIHIVNIWSLEMPVEAAYHQIYAAACVGVLFAAIYLKTRSLFLLSVVHFLTNFFSGISELLPAVESAQAIPDDPTITELIIEEVLSLVIYGIPLFIGWFILKTVETNETEGFTYMPSDEEQEKEELVV